MAISDADGNDSDPDGSTEQMEGIEGAETSSHEGENLSVSVINSDLDESTKQTEGSEGDPPMTRSRLSIIQEQFEKELKRRAVGYTPIRELSYREILRGNDNDLDESTEQTEWIEETEWQCTRESYFFHPIDWKMYCFDKDCIAIMPEFRAQRGESFFDPIEIERLEAERQRLEAEWYRDIAGIAERLANVKKWMEWLQELFELFRYLCLVLQTSTLTQTSRSKEEKCIVQLLLIRSGVESNPGPDPRPDQNRVWIGDIPEMQLPTHADIFLLASCIGKDWRLLGPRLRVGEAKLDHIEHDNKTMQSRICHMLQKSTKPPLKASLKDILLILDDASTKSMVNIDWADISDHFTNIGNDQQTFDARLVDLENRMTTVHAKQVEQEEQQNKVPYLEAQIEELKREMASLKRGLQKRNAEEGETSTNVKRVKHQ